MQRKRAQREEVVCSFGIGMVGLTISKAMRIHRMCGPESLSKDEDPKLPVTAVELPVDVIDCQLESRLAHSLV